MYMGRHRIGIIIIAVILTVFAVACAAQPPGYSDSLTVTLSVRVDSLLDNMDFLNPEMHELVPADGVIFPTAEVKAFEGESVFDVLQREMRNAGIHMAFRGTPLYDSAYITAINNIYEFDAGPLSGWLYTVNGEWLGIGASRHILQNGDAVEWIYTLDLGRDVGAGLAD